MENVEIEKKYLVDISTMPFKPTDYPFHVIEQAYLNTNPVVRIRKSDNDYYLTYKGSGMMERTEFNLPLNKESYYHLLEKADGKIISKKRYLIPYESHTIELDIFEGDYTGLILAEVEFENRKAADNFIPPSWFINDVTFSKEYHNSTLALKNWSNHNTTSMI